MKKTTYHSLTHYTITGAIPGIAIRIISKSNGTMAVPPGWFSATCNVEVGELRVDGTSEEFVLQSLQMVYNRYQSQKRESI